MAANYYWRRENDYSGRPNTVWNSKIFKILLQRCFFGMECTQNGCRLLFRIFEYVIWFCWVFTERVENWIFRHNCLHECSWSFAWFSKKFSHSASENVSVFLASEIYLQRVKRFLSKKMKLQWNEVLSIDYLNSIKCWPHWQIYKKLLHSVQTDTSKLS